MSLTHIIKEIGRGCEGAKDLSTDEAYRLYGAMLDGGVPELELGAILMALRMKTESPGEVVGFHFALAERVYKLARPSGELRPIVLPSYNGARHQPNLLPLLALELRRFGIPVLVHGTLEGHGRVASAYIFRELGILPSATLGQAERALQEEGIVFVPTAALSPGLATLISLRNRLGLRSSAHSLAKLIDPFDGNGIRIVSVSHPAYMEKMRSFLRETAADALLMRATEGEPFANPKRRPQIEFFTGGESQVLFEAEVGPIRQLPNLPDAIDPVTTANWIRQVVAGEIPLPLPIVNQLACCLFAAGYTQDMNQAKAIVAVQTNSLVGA